ncbi:MAG TPA: Ku protein [Candidatus Binataceae bacterium]|nr:Ku protein [Candidatus Binataceae bacterium]
MAARPIATGSISFGLVSIPVKLFTATRSKSVSFKLLHGKDQSRIQQKIYCPVDDAIVDRSELVRGYEIEKNTFVTFTDEELKALEAKDDHMIDISEFVPLAQVDPIYFENSYHLGCEPQSARAYRLLTAAMDEMQVVALARYTMRNKEYSVIVRPYEQGLMLHTMYYSDEVVSASDVDRGKDTKIGAQELNLAKRLIKDLEQDQFDPTKFHDNYRERVVAAAQEKAEGHEVATAAPEPRKAKVIDLYDALKASLEKRGVAMAGQQDEAGEERETAHASKRRARPARAASSGSRRK